MGQSKLAARIRSDAKDARRIQTKIDSWLQLKPDQRKKLDEAALVFSEVKSHDFSWRGFALVLQAELKDFPPGFQHVKTWFTTNYPELFEHGHRQTDT